MAFYTMLSQLRKIKNRAMNISARKLLKALDMLPEPTTYHNDLIRIPIADEIMKGHFFRDNMEVSKHSIDVIYLTFKRERASHGLEWILESQELLKFKPE